MIDDDEKKNQRKIRLHVLILRTSFKCGHHKTWWTHGGTSLNGFITHSAACAYSKIYAIRTFTVQDAFIFLSASWNTATIGNKNCNFISFSVGVEPGPSR